MTSKAISYRSRILDVIFRYQLASQIFLIRRVLIVNIEDLGFWPDELFRVPVTVHAPVHVEVVHAVSERHLIHLSMASGAPDSFVDVNAVIEINEVGKIVDANPLN